ncbi:MAG: PQQ-binding-like beta-propeller repeat protein [Gemmatimonadetes bacterium]|nr:PQQ-binding-like beta-propeller repeat protein [Gemmatimonadota bacterium]
MIHSIATRKITAFLFAMAWLTFVGQGTSHSQPPVEEGKIYWANPIKGIHRSSLDGTNVEQLVKPELRYPADIALDVLRGKMYWTDRWLGGGIYWSDLDGSNLKPFMDDDYRSIGVTNIALDVDGGKIYWTSEVIGGDVLNGWVARANLDGSNSEAIFDGAAPGDIALDLVRGKVYWTDLGFEGILRADLDGQNVEYDYIRAGFPGGIALDVDGGKVYWTDVGTIQRADLDGQNREEVLTVSDGYPEEITLDLERGKVYWTNPSTQTIQRADLDGQNREYLYDLEDDVHYIHSGPRTGIALDSDQGKIYWTDSGPGTIQRADLDGQNREVLFDPIVREPYGIALDTDKMYWTDEVKGTIQRADFNGQNIEVLITGLNRPKRIDLLDGNKLYWTDEGTGKYRGRHRPEPETGKIQAANLDGSNIEDVLTGLSYPDGIALDAVQDKIYWNALGEKWEHTIQRANLDGSNVEGVIPKLSDTFLPGGIALDVLASKIYWMAAGRKAIRRAELDGSNVEDIATLSQGEWIYYTAFDLDLIGNKIYWSTLAEAPAVGEWGTIIWAEEIFRSNLDGSNVEEIGKVPVSPTDIALDISHPTSISTPPTTPTIPTTSSLSPNFPNPFNASTQIAYDIASPGPVRLTIYNILGQPVRTLVNQFQPAGSYQVRWDARDQRGTALAAGVYLVRLHYPGGEQTRRLLLLK